MQRQIVLGARSSKMAVIIAEQVKSLIDTRTDLLTEIKTFSSAGDKIAGDLRVFGGKGAFVKDLEQRLLSREIDCAVHCLKDVPGDEPMHSELTLCAFLAREDERDALLLHPSVALEALGSGAGRTLATSSPRRQALLRMRYPEAQIIPLRGNVDTRFRKLQEKQFDGMVLSYAGLKRLGLESHATHIFSCEEMLPAVGQGVLCLQIRKADSERFANLREKLNCPLSDAASSAERQLLHTLNGDCYSAIAGYCTVASAASSAAQGTCVTLRGLVASVDGKKILQASASVDSLGAAAELGRRVADQLLNQGALALIQNGQQEAAG
jgi:hydroxymethylbilane synthase